MHRFYKQLLRVATYRPQGNVLEITPERLRHWAKGIRDFQRLGYVIPMHFDHGLNSMFPVTQSEFEYDLNRSASKTVGRLETFEVSPDGQSAELICELLTADSVSKAGANAVYLSPVIHPTWKDGFGNRYRDVIGSVDLVDFPVDVRQGPFIAVPATAPSSSVKTKTKSSPPAAPRPTREEMAQAVAMLLR